MRGFAGTSTGTGNWIIVRKLTTITTIAALLAAVSCCRLSSKGATASDVHDRNGVLHEVWKGIEGTHVKHLTGSPRYAKPADEVRALDSFEFRSIGDNYGSRSTALLVPPVTGSYTFWLASDDAGQLLLSADDTAARSRLVAEVKTHTAWNQWTKEPGQKSQPVPLRAGQAYFIQALQKEGIYGDLMRVAWKGPGFRRKIIESKHLRLPSVGDKMQGRIDKTRKADAKQRALSDKAARYWKAGKTLPVRFCSIFPVDRQEPVPNDTGINVLMDQAHQTMFHALWGLRGFIRGQGFRVCTSLASLDCVLEPGRHNRIRLGVGDKEPFAWWPTPEFNVVTTSQQDLKAQYYTPKERKALTRFVENGGGLMVFGGLPADQGAGGRLEHEPFPPPVRCARHASTPTRPMARRTPRWNSTRNGKCWRAASKAARSALAASSARAASPYGSAKHRSIPTRTRTPRTSGSRS